jgi:alpha-galactosidase
LLLPEFLILHSPACTAIWEVSQTEAPLWRYWGPRLPDGVSLGDALRSSRPEPSFALHFDQPLSLFPGLGMGWFGSPALEAHRAGQDWALQITQCRVVRPDANTVQMHLRDDVALIAATITARLDPDSDVLTLSTELRNEGDAVLDVQWLAAGSVPLPEDAVSVCSYGGRHNNEFALINDELSRSTWRRENRRGLTSHECFPGAVVSCQNGTAYGAQLGWSGNHVNQIEWIEDGRLHWQMGEWLTPGEVRLAPGESIATPEMLATCSAEGANGIAWNFHRAIRQRIAWPDGTMSPRRVHLNTWEGFYFDHDEAALKELATSAAEIGIERFVLDDGWFAGRNDDTSSLGDWWPDPVKYPQELGPLASHVTALGMEFGLWVEPEMVNRDSALFRAHPDWALAVPGRPLLEARHQLVLNLTRPEVSDYLYDKIAALLDSLPISYLKWDHNRVLTHAGASPLYRQQILAAYALMARVRAGYPHVEIEACAGGGGRIDAGIVRHSHRFWASDCIDAVSRVAVQRAFLQFMPPEVMGCHVGTSPAHSTGRSQSMHFRAGVALSGHFGVEFDLCKVSGAEREELRHWIGAYKVHRDKLHGTRVWTGEAAGGLLWQAHGDAADLLLFLIRTAPSDGRYPPQVPLPMVDPAKRYHLSRDGAEDIVLDGGWLRQVGFAAPPMKGEDVMLYRVNAL